MKEIWKNIVGYEGKYQISNLGRVKSLARTRIGKGGSIYDVQERILNPGLIGHEGNQYYAVNLYINGVRKTRRIHQLVAQAFIDQNYISNGLVANHIDGDTLNNNLSNLELITQRSNNSTEKCVNKIVTSKMNGVCWHKRCSNWKSQIYIEGILYYLGYFTEEIAAHLTYQRALNIYLENGLDSFLKFKETLRKIKKRSLTNVHNQHTNF